MFDTHFNGLKNFGILIDGRMCGGKVMKCFRFVCNIILFENENGCQIGTLCLWGFSSPYNDFKVREPR